MADTGGHSLTITFAVRACFSVKLAYSYSLMSFIYRLIEIGNPILSDQIHNYQRHHRRDYDAPPPFKFFTFGRLNGRAIINRGQIRFIKQATFEVRSPDKAIIDAIIAGLVKRQHFTFMDNAVDVIGFSCQKTDLQHVRRLVARTLSPITVYRTEATGKTIYFHPQQPEFIELIVRNMTLKYRSFYGFSPKPALDVHLVPDGIIKKTVTTFKRVLVTAYDCELELTGASYLLQFAYDTGLGAKNSNGFGMFKIIHSV